MRISGWGLRLIMLSSKRIPPQSTSTPNNQLILQDIHLQFYRESIPKSNITTLKMRSSVHLPSAKLSVQVYHNCQVSFHFRYRMISHSMSLLYCQEYLSTVKNPRAWSFLHFHELQKKSLPVPSAMMPTTEFLLGHFVPRVIPVSAFTGIIPVNTTVANVLPKECQREIDVKLREILGLGIA